MTSGLFVRRLPSFLLLSPLVSIRKDKPLGKKNKTIRMTGLLRPTWTSLLRTSAQAYPRDVCRQCGAGGDAVLPQ